MSNMPHSIRLAVLAGAGVSGLAAGSVAHAQAAISAAEAGAASAKNHVSNYVDLSGSVGYSTNPRLSSSGSSSSSVVGRVSAYAVHSVQSDRDSIQLTGYIENQSYLTGSSSTQVFSLSAAARHVASERVTLFGNASFNGDIGGQLYNRFIAIPTAPPMTDVGNPLPPGSILDPTYISLNRRQYRLSGQGGLDYKLSERDSLNATAGYEHVFFSGSGSDLNYDTLTGSFGWNRQFSERTTGGLRVVVQRVDYGSRGHSVVVSPQVTASTTLAEGWTASGAIGASIIDQSTFMIHDRRVDLSFNGTLCRQTESESICASGSRGAQSAIGEGLATSTSASLSYFRRLSQKDTVQAGVSVTQTSHDNAFIGRGSSRYYTASASYNRKISSRLSTGVDGSVSKVRQTGYDVPVQATGVVYLRYRLGDLQ